MAQARPNAFTATEVISTGYAMIAVTSMFACGRVAAHIVAPRKLTPEDVLVVLAYACNLTMCALYISLMPVDKRLSQVALGKIEPYPAMMDEYVFIARRYFVALLSFWTILWLVKFAFLLLHRKLLSGIPKVYTWIWWGIVATCVLTLPVNYALYLSMCSEGVLKFYNGTCTDAVMAEQLVSLLFSYASDVVTNIMIMALPIRLTWNLRMQRAKKIGVIFIFATATLCIIVATVRVGQISHNSIQNPEGQMDGTWLAVWGMAESSCAVIVGFIPASAALIRVAADKKSSSGKLSNPQGYHKHSTGYSRNLSRPGEFEMAGLSSKSIHVKKEQMVSAASSQEVLAPGSTYDAIVVGGAPR